MLERPQDTSAVQVEAETIRLGDTQLVPDLSGALWLPELRTLLVADLHFEKGSSFAVRGVHLPPYDTGSTLTMLEQAAARYQPIHYRVQPGGLALGYRPGPGGHRHRATRHPAHRRGAGGRAGVGPGPRHVR